MLDIALITSQAEVELFVRALPPLIRPNNTALMWRAGLPICSRILPTGHRRIPICPRSVFHK